MLNRKRLMASPRMGHDGVYFHRPERTTVLTGNKGDYFPLTGLECQHGCKTALAPPALDVVTSNLMQI